MALFSTSLCLKVSSTLRFLFYLGKPLGKGTFGQVKQGTHILTGEKVSDCPLSSEAIGSSDCLREISMELFSSFIDGDAL